MSATGNGVLQKAVVRRLRACGDFLALCPTGVLDSVPQDATYPMVVVDAPFEIPNRTLGQGGHDCLVTLNIYTQDGSVSKTGRGASGYKQGQDIAEIVVRELTNLDEPLEVEGHDVEDVDLVSVTGEELDESRRRTEIILEALLEDSDEAN